MGPAETVINRGTSRGRRSDQFVTILLAACALLVLLIVLGILGELIHGSWASLKAFGWHFLVSSTWNPYKEKFGGLSSITDTLVTTFIAMLLATPLSLMISLFLVELAPKRLATVVGGAIELLAAIPSIIFGMWGLFVFAPYMSEHIEPVLQSATKHIPLVNHLFDGAAMGVDVLTASLILTLMILPYMTAIARDVLGMTPSVLRESAYGMGSTTWEVTRRVTIPFGSRGLIGAGFLALSRALGETMAVTFVIGNSHTLSASLLSAGNTIASTLANEFNNPSGPLHLSAMIELALILFVISILAQVAAYGLLSWTQRSVGNAA